MAARNRPRVQKDDDAHEERNMWTQISGDLKKIKPINNKAGELAVQIQELEEKMAKSGKSPCSKISRDCVRPVYFIRFINLNVCSASYCGVFPDVFCFYVLEAYARFEPWLVLSSCRVLSKFALTDKRKNFVLYDWYPT